MGLFKKKDKKEGKDSFKLPDLPKLPELPSFDNLDSSSQSPQKETLPQLPSFPSSSVGEKFSQNSIKEAVAGKKEVEKEATANEFELPELPEAPRMQEPLVSARTKDIEEYESEKQTKPEVKEFKRTPPKIAHPHPKSDEPVFIRIDKFEESLKLFEKTKEQIEEIEEMIRETRAIKEKEEEELVHWETQIQSVKQQVEKVDRDLFSKIE